MGKFCIFLFITITLLSLIHGRPQNHEIRESQDEHEINVESSTGIQLFIKPIILDFLLIF